MNSAVTTSTTRRAGANGIELAYDSFGERSRTPLLLVMGLGTQMIGWDDEFCAALAERGHWVVRFDNRDVGESTRLDQLGVPDIGAMIQASMAGQPVDAPYRLSDMADDAFGLLDALGADEAHVVGASMGGAIAQEMAMRRPARVRTLTSIMASSGAPNLPPPTAEALQMLLTPTPTEYDAYLVRYRQTWRVLRGVGFPLDEARDEARAQRAYARGLSPAGTARQLAAIIASGSRKAGLQTLHTPTLVIHGDADPLVPLAHGLDVAASVPGAKRLVIARMGHALPIGMWPQIVDAIAAHAAP